VESIAAAPDAAPADAGLRRRVEALPEKQRQAVTLYYLDERPVEEVAEMMGLPVNTVKTHLHRARASLAAALGAAAEERA
jgi:RNA polymerase sigma-70 factor (ECF subfamily)